MNSATYRISSNFQNLLTTAEHYIIASIRDYYSDAR